MSRAARPHQTIEGRRGSRIDLEEGGRYLVSPETATVRAFTTVHGTGCGTDRSKCSTVELRIWLFRLYFFFLGSSAGFTNVMAVGPTRWI